ncbi:contractile injection system sheath initiator [Clostridium haemolyticum]|uniref:Phage protein n=1 Tax=Clostridium haemolyticum NCTC 9693 TaxID=1443114 RepID=A0ABR4TJN2_CLOHA|nr:DUF2634 domain-containing protein [Clostridium haemolyticum]KEI18245.1 hypothetical protein Z960_03740 [Clostridium haemolyticum NCTC 9693]KGN04166.1 hypothetical protein Z961_04235 [Clostridium haemolyticum NCTC 8350]
MKSIKIENGDIVFTSKRLTLVDELEQKIQRTKGLLQISLGELFYNADIGLNMKEVLSIEDKVISEDRKRMAIRECLSKDDNIEKIKLVDIKTNKKTRKDTINLKIKYKGYDEIIDVGGIQFD